MTFALIAAAAALAASEFHVESQGFKLHVRSVGGKPDSPALILVHGGPGLSGAYFRPLERLANPNLRVVTYDQRSVGKSSRAPKNAEGKYDPALFSIAAYVADLDAVVAALKPARLHLLGHSWGGMVVQAFVGAHPDRAATIVLVSAVPPTRAAFAKGYEAFQARIERLKKEGLIPDKSPPPQGEDCMPRVRSILPVYYHDPALKPAADQIAFTCTHGVGAATSVHMAEFDHRAGLAKFRGRALVFEGKSDPFSLAWADDSAAALTNAAALDKITPDACGHMPWTECPQPFYAAMEKLLAP